MKELKACEMNVLPKLHLLLVGIVVNINRYSQLLQLLFKLGVFFLPPPMFSKANSTIKGAFIMQATNLSSLNKRDRKKMYLTYIYTGKVGWIRRSRRLKDHVE